MEENTLNQQPVVNLEEPIIDQPEQLGPALPENQDATQIALDEQALAQEEENAKFEQAKASVANSTPLGFGKDIPDEQAFLEMEKLEDEKQKQALIDEENAKLDQQALQAKLDNRKAIIERAAARGITLKEDPELDPLIKRQEEEAIAQQEALQLQEQQTAERIAQAQTPDEQEIEVAAAPIRQQRANMEAEQREQSEEKIQQARIQESKQSRLEEIDTKINAINQMKVDPNRYWNNQSTGQKIVAALAMALGAYNQSLTGQNNVAMDIINKQIETDVQEQRDQRKLAVDEVNALRADYWKQVGQKMDEMQFRSGERVRNAQVQNIHSQIQERGLSARQNAEQLAADRAALNMAGRGGDIPPEVLSRLDKEDRKRYVPGYGLAKDAKSAELAGKALESADAIMDAVKSIENLHAEFGTREVLDRGAVASESSARRNMQLQLKELFNLGVLNGPDLDLLNEFTGDDFFSVTTTDASKRAKLQGVRNYVKSKVSSNLKRAGLRSSVEKKTKLDNAIDVYKKRGMSEQKARSMAMKLQKAGYLGN